MGRWHHAHIEQSPSAKPAAVVAAYRASRYTFAAGRALEARSADKLAKGMVPLVFSASGVADPLQMDAVLGKGAHSTLDITLSLVLLRGEARLFKRHYDRDRVMAEEQHQALGLAESLELGAAR